MFTRNSSLLLAAASLLLGVQAPTVDSGVLLGVRAGDGYHSYWIVHDPSGAPPVAVALTGIVVPHGNGFWRVGVSTVCEFDGTSNGNRAVIWEGPAETVPTVYQRAPCVQRRGVRTCGDAKALIRFVSPTLIAEEYSEGQTEACEPRGGRATTTDHVRRLGQVQPLSVADFVTDSVEDAYWQALQDGDDALRSGGTNCPPPTEDEMDLKSWSITHTAGAWHPAADFSIEVTDCDIDYPLARVMPRSATADGSSEELLRAAQSQMPELQDLFVSPNGAWGVAAGELNGARTLAVYEITEKHLGRKLLDLPGTFPMGANSVVSAQWALGSHAAAWTGMLETAGKLGDVKARVVVDPKRAGAP